MSVSEFVKHWIENSTQEGCDVSISEPNGMPVLYLKDWHFVKVRVQISSFGCVTDYLVLFKAVVLLPK